MVEIMIVSMDELRAHGISRGELRAQVRTGDLVRVAPGRFISKESVPPWPEERHRVAVVAHASRTRLLVSHTSAAVLLGLPVPGADLSTVHLTRPGHGGNERGRDRTVHAGRISEEWVTTVDGIRTTTVARTLADVARIEPVRASLTAADAALHRGLCVPDDLVAALGTVCAHRGAERARYALSLADGLCESPGETWVRLTMHQLGLPEPALQVEVYDERGRFVGRADGALPAYGLLWEYDGVAKYTDLRRPDQSIEQVVIAEKNREQGFRELGWTVLRFDKSHRDRSTFHDRFARAIAAAQRPGWQPPRGSHRLPVPRRLPPMS